MNTKPTYTQGSLQPVEAGAFSYRQHLRDMRDNKWRTNPIPPLPATFDAPALIQSTAVAGIRKAFTQSKTSKDAWKSHQRNGRFDPRAMTRASRMDQDVFRLKADRSTTKVKVAVLIDSSGSMSKDDAYITHPADPNRKVKVQRRMAAAVFGATIAKAIGQVPTIDLDVFQHSAGTDLFMKWRWHKGTPVGVFNEAIYGQSGGMNADGHALIAVAQRMEREIKRGERGVIMMVSDGLPSVYASDGVTATGTDRNAQQALIDAVGYCRKQGFTVIAVAIDGSDQSVYYGKDGMIPFTGNWTALGTALAKVIGKALASR